MDGLQHDATSYQFLSKINEINDELPKVKKKESCHEVKKVFQPEDLRIDDVDERILKKTQNDIKKIKVKTSQSLDIVGITQIKEFSQ